MSDDDFEAVKGDIVVDFAGNVLVVEDCAGGPLGVCWVRDSRRNQFQVYNGDLRLAPEASAAEFKKDWNACIQNQIKELTERMFTTTSDSTHEQTDS